MPNHSDGFSYSYLPLSSSDFSSTLNEWDIFRIKNRGTKFSARVFRKWFEWLKKLGMKLSKTEYIMLSQAIENKDGMYNALNVMHVLYDLMPRYEKENIEFIVNFDTHFRGSSPLSVHMKHKGDVLISSNLSDFSDYKYFKENFKNFTINFPYINLQNIFKETKDVGFNFPDLIKKMDNIIKLDQMADPTPDYKIVSPETLPPHYENLASYEEKVNYNDEVYANQKNVFTAIVISCILLSFATEIALCSRLVSENFQYKFKDHKRYINFMVNRAEADIDNILNKDEDNAFNKETKIKEILENFLAKINKKIEDQTKYEGVVIELYLSLTVDELHRLAMLGHISEEKIKQNPFFSEEDKSQFIAKLSASTPRGI
ncbi:hypothetical protein REG_1569 [Candidatus Regiella insecticola LSR1]|uniref:Uncharacterized protein n=1 Tax=Candidatus Regiella insecticola LSR1 TaxID=663321 RepID=E0WU26_9ENTR|nr:hypothetical protein [Candidatus Regiella insecticola]EFL91491.1 hypothetical protein REG_1569 [Candidatus Regiella insecticola LSR1]